MVGLIWWILVGAAGGWLAGYFKHKDTTLDLSDVVVGVIGAIVGGIIFTFLSPIINVSGITPTEYTTTVALTPGKSYRWRVSATDGSNVSPFSADTAFAIDLRVVGTRLVFFRF